MHMCDLIAQNLIHRKIEVLKTVLARIEATEYVSGLCRLLDPNSYIPRYWEACKELRRYINDALGEYVWLEEWYEAKFGYYPEREQILNARIMWVKWMIAELEKQLENVDAGSAGEGAR